MFKCPKCGKNLVEKVEKDGVGATDGSLPKPVAKYECLGCGYRPKRKELDG